MTLNLRRAFSFVVLAALALSLASCGPSNHASDERYVFVAVNNILPYWQDARAGFMGAAHDMGVKADFVGAPNYDPAAELKAFQDAVAQHPSGILVSPAQPGLFKDDINKAVEQGIPVITADSDSPESKRIAFIGTDNYRAGVQLGKLLARILHGNGGVAVFTIPGQFNLDERFRGLQDGIKSSPYLTLQWTYDDKGDPAIAESEATDLVSKWQVKGIACLDASGGPAAAKALSQAGKGGSIPIVSMDANPETLRAISGGLITATVAQKPYTMAFYGLRFLDDLHHNSVHQFTNWKTAPTSPLPQIIDTGTTVVNAQNVDDYRNAMAQAAAE